METLKQYALQLVGVAYKWGGKHPAQGLDCSGLSEILLKSVGQDPPGFQNAQALFNYLVQPNNGQPTNTIQLGNFIFFGESSTKITHVAMALDPYRMIEAAGGDHLTVTLEDAIAKNAFVKITLIKRRADLVGIVRPNYSKIGYTN